MRLTLRTLLAYLDEMLEPSQAEELSQKIRESDFASGLVHRIRNSMGRLRVSCPQILGTGLTNDANTVAQYLDNQLPTDRVSDFEKICLESDMHLAEVASCHQILALVLGERAQVSEPLRARVYAIPHKYQSMSAGPPPAAPPIEETPGVGGDGHGSHLQPASHDQGGWHADAAGGNHQADLEHPSFARKPRRSTLWIPATLMIFLLGIATAYLIGDRFFKQSMASKENDTEQQDPSALAGGQDGRFNPPPFAPVMEHNGPQTEPAETSSNQSIYGSPPPEVQNNLITEANPSPGSLNGSSTFSPPTAEGFAKESSPADQQQPPAAGELPSVSELGEPVSNGSATVTQEAADAIARRSAPIGSPDSTMRESEPSASAFDRAQPSLTPSDDMEPAITATPQDFGRFLLAVVSAVKVGDQWMRADERESLRLGTRIRVPVAFPPPMIVLGNSVRVTLGGRSELEVRDFLRAGILHFGMEYGRAIVSSTSAQASRVAVTVNDRTYLVTFHDTDGEFALEVVPYFLPGDDALSETRPRRVRLWPSKGRIIVSEQGSKEAPEEVFVAERESMMILGDQDPVLIEKDELPPWVDENRLDPVEKQALYRLEPILDANRPLPITLAEVAQSKRADLKSLATRGLGSFDRFDPLVKSLDDARMHAYWKSHVLELQAAMARSAESARKIKVALEARFGPESRSIHRMLRGYSAEQLQQYGANDLVEALSHEELPYRVVALNTLQQITGKTLHYVPKDSASKRKPYLAEWRDRLRRGQIRYASAQIEPLGVDL